MDCKITVPILLYRLLFSHKENRKELYGIVKIVYDHKKMVILKMLPAPKDYVRLYSPFSLDIYSDVLIDAFCKVEINTRGHEESIYFFI